MDEAAASGHTDPDEQWEGDPLLRFVGENLGPVAAGFVVVAMLWAVLSAARFDVATAIAIYTTAGALTVVGGLLLHASSIVLVIAVLATWLWTRRLVRQKRPFGASAWVSVVVLLAALFAVPLAQLASAGLLLVGVWVWGKVRGRVYGAFRREHPTGDLITADAVAIMALGALQVALTAGSVWLPPERLTMRSIPVEVGYVLSSSDAWTAVLVEKDRSVQWVHTDDIVGRQICALSPTRLLTLAQLDAASPVVPSC